MKRLISFVLVLVMLLSLIPTTVFAQNEGSAESPSALSSAVSVTGDSGIGSIISDAVEDKQEEDAAEDISNKIIEATVSGKVVTVEFNNTQQARIIAALFDEEKSIMLASGMADVEANAGTARINIDTDEMPEYFVLKVFLLDEKNNPLDSSYENIEYTKYFQEFLAQTVNDFEEEKVLNLDSSNNNNFAVYDDETLLLEESEHNKLESADDESKTYVFSNIDDSIASLQAGDIFSYSYGENLSEYIIVKVKSISVEGTTATVVGEEEVPIDEVFSFVKIDTDATGENAEVDTSQADDGVEYLGVKTEPAPSGKRNSYQVEGSYAHEWALSKEFANKSDNAKVKFKASLGIEITVDLEIFLSWKLFSIELNVLEKTEFSFSITGSIDLWEPKLGSIKVPIGVADVKVGIDVHFVGEFSGAVSFKATKQSEFGFRFDTKAKKFVNLSKPTKFDTDAQLEIELFVGLKLVPNIEAFCGVAKVSLEGKVGAKIKAETRNREDTDSVKHLCDHCVAISIRGVLELEVELKVELKFKKISIFDFTRSKKLAAKEFEIGDFYFSPDVGWGKGECPNSSYLIKFYVSDTSMNRIPGAAIGIHLTDNVGKYEAFYKPGDYSVTVSKDDYQTEEFSFTVKNSPDSQFIRLRKYGETPNYKWNGTGIGNVIHKGNNEGTTKVYFYDVYNWGDIYAYTYRMLPAMNVDEALGIWPGIKCKYEGSSIWSVDMPNSCTHILFSGSGVNTQQTSDIPNPGRTMLAVRGVGEELNGVGHYQPVFEWEEYEPSLVSVGDVFASDDEIPTDPDISTKDEEPAVIIEDTITISDLTPGAVYAFMMLKGGIENYSVDTESLVYISDAVADENGNVDFTYYYEELNEEWVAVIFGPCNHNLGDWQTIEMPSVNSTGLKVQICNKCQEVVNKQIIPAVDAEELTEFTLYFSNDDNWYDVYAYVWSDAGEELFGEWPGTPCKYVGDNIWSIVVPVEYTNIIFNCDLFGYKTDDLVVPGNEYIYRELSYWEKYGFDEPETTIASTDAPETTAAPESTAATDAPETTAAPESTAATDAPETTAAPESTAATDAPETTAAPESTAATDAPETTAAPESTATTDAPETAVVPESSTSAAEVPENTTASESSVVTTSTAEATETTSSTAATESSSSAETTEPDADKGILGDVTGDGKVNIKDATQIQKAAAKLINFTEAEIICADVNADEKVNVKDVTAIQKYAAKIETGLPVGEKIK